MGSITIRNIPDDVHKGLKLLASSNDRSTEAEVRNILAKVVAEKSGLGLGSVMRASWGDNLGDDLEIERSKDGPREVDFE